MTKHLTGVPPVSSTYCMTHDSHTRCRSSFRKSETSERPGTRNLETRECVLASALYTMMAGVALLVQGFALQQTRNFSAGDHSTLQEREEVWDHARLKHTRI